VSPSAPLTRHPLAIAGALLATISGVAFAALLIGMLTGLFDNPYAGLVIYVAVPAAFVLGLLMIPAGMWLQRRRLRANPDADLDWPVFDFRLSGTRRFALVVIALTAINLVIVLVAGYGGIHHMESPVFCGQTCHVPMTPQFTAWQSGEHAKIACVSCHVGEGARGFAHAKLAGTRQLAHVVTGNFPRPIPPGAHQFVGGFSLTCARCHQPGRTAGDVIRVKREYAEDEANTETMTVLLMHVGRANPSGRSIHWHADPATNIEFAATDNSRQTVNYVKVTDAKGQTKEYFSPEAGGKTPGADSLRRMDCVDCHNTVGHPIAADAEHAVNAALEAGDIGRTLPFARREGVRLLKASYAGEDAARQQIDTELRKFYSSEGRTADAPALGRAVAALQRAYSGNNFAAMKVTFGTYPNNIGHMTSPGCFRCHDGSKIAKDGTTINGDCEYCHTQVERN
jgi:hypothetical protein